MLPLCLQYRVNCVFVCALSNVNYLLLDYKVGWNPVLHFMINWMGTLCTRSDIMLSG